MRFHWKFKNALADIAVMQAATPEVDFRVYATDASFVVRKNNTSETKVVKKFVAGSRQEILKVAIHSDNHLRFYELIPDTPCFFAIDIDNAFNIIDVEDNGEPYFLSSLKTRIIHIRTRECTSQNARDIFKAARGCLLRFIQETLTNLLHLPCEAALHSLDASSTEPSFKFSLHVHPNVYIQQWCLDEKVLAAGINAAGFRKLQ